MSTNAAQNVQKYLLFFSYFGKSYSGVQSQTRRIPIVGKVPTVDNSVQFQLEKALKALVPRPVNEVKMSVSSRTDKGVHAMVNTCQFFLKHPKENHIYKPNYITRTMNQELMEKPHSIVTVPVHNLFDSRRHVLSRTYVYRIAVIKLPHGFKKLKDPRYLLPIDELDRCWPVCPTQGYLDIDKMQEVCDMFVGTHNFSAFEASNKEMRSPERNIFECCMRLIPESFIYSRDPAYKNIDFIEILVRGKSFLYRQVRRMVGVIVSVGRGSLDTNTVHSLLSDPENNKWKYITAPADGLYLSDIKYDENDFHNPRILNPKLREQLRNDTNRTTETASEDDDNQSYPRAVNCS